MNEVDYKAGSNYDFDTLYTLNQAFVDTVRKTGGNNANRLLLISVANINLEQTCSPSFKMPKDSAKMLAVSIHYYLLPQFTVESDEQTCKLGTEADYKEMVSNFETMKLVFTSKGITVLLGECGVTY